MTNNTASKIKIRCPYCSHVFLYQRRHAGESETVKYKPVVLCPYCEKKVQLPPAVETKY